MRVPLVLRPVAGRVALRPRDCDHSCFAAKHFPLLPPLSVGGVLRAVVPAPFAAGAAALARHHHRAVVHETALLAFASALDETVLKQKDRVVNICGSTSTNINLRQCWSSGSSFGSRSVWS